MKKEYQELKNLIETIVTTAKLLNYNVQQRKETVYYIYEEEGESTAYMVLALYANNNSVFSSFTKAIVLNHEPHQEKINHLKSLLQNL